MWGNKTAVAPLVTAITAPEPHLKLVPAPELSYIEQCEAVGAKQLADISRLTMILAVEVGGVYDVDEVNRFLKKHCPKEKNVIWRPLAGKCRNDSTQGSWSYMDGGYRVLIGSDRKYSKLVPQVALSLVAMIEKEIPDSFGYYVSDYDVVRPDPFLLIEHATTGRCFVACHWDEPDWK